MPGSRMAMLTLTALLAISAWAESAAVPQAYRVSAKPGSALRLEPPALPDLSGYTAAAVAAKIAYKPTGHARIKEMLHEDALAEFIGGNERLREWVVRQRRMPQAIFIEQGYMRSADLARQLPKEAFVESAPGVYLARLPIVVRPGATLHIDQTTEELRLSQERGAFLVNDGKLFITDTKVTAWREKEGAPASFRKPGEFRPFLIAWGGTETYIVGSTITSLGYEASKSYGVSLSPNSPNMERARPTGWLLNSEFVDHWFGFYCYEADDVVLKDNRYRGSIIYGIDPHDRSRRLIIAGNQVSGTKQKHGVILSREVNDSWIFNNHIHDNQLSGLVLDRNSESNLIAYNEVSQNHSDGITLYESSNNLLWGNRVIGNQRHGVHLRNSLNIRLYENLVAGNGLAGVYGHIKDLSGSGRDSKKDPYDTKVSLVLVGGKLVGNGSSPLVVDSPQSVVLYRVELLAPSKSIGISFSGLLGEKQSEIMDILLHRQQAVLIEPSNNLTSKE